jgi:peptidoglycan/LPS O-acetylase OafA/YrhL
MSESISARIPAPIPAPEGPVRRPPTRRLGSLTGMRFFAALGVVLIHVGGQFSPHGGWVAAAEGFGYIGVSFFFVLSGFVLTWSSADQPARRFWWLRFARVWPTQAVFAVFAMTVIAAKEQIPGPLGRAADMVLLQAWSPRQAVYYGGNGVSWSLSAEMFFYLLFPLAVVPLRRMGGRGLAITAFGTLAVMFAAPLAVITVGVSGVTYAWLFFVFPPYRFAEFLLGMILARALLLGLRVPAPRLSWLVGALGLVGTVWGMNVHTMSTHSAIERPYVALLVLPFFVLMLAAGASHDLTGRPWWLSSRPLLRLGEWSFALYLVHKPTFIFTDRFHWWDNSGGLSGLACFVEYLALAVTVAALVHHGIEKPVERALRRLPVGSGSRRGEPAPAAAAA